MSFAIRIATPKSIRAQLTLWYLVMLGGSLIAFALFVFWFRAQTLHREAGADLQVETQRIARDMRPALLELDVAGALAAEPRIAADPIVVRERSGAVVFRSPAFPQLSAPTEAAATRAARTGEDLLEGIDRSGHPMMLATVVAVRTGASPLIVQRAASTAPIRHALEQLAASLALFFCVVLAIASYGGSFIARRALRPVEVINARVRDIQASRLSERLDVDTGSAELDALVQTLNGMLDRLDSSMQGARRFAADASHELQTPIAAMRTAIDVLTRVGCSGMDRCLMAGDLAAELERMSLLIRDLRLLALADAGHLVDRVERVDLTTLVRESAEIVRAVAEPKRIAVSVDILSDMTVEGSALHLRRALLNLAHNAVRYSAEGATVQITAGRLEHDAVIAVVDEGCGIPERDLPHIFERFYRADPARARDTGGSGLGLAIADQIVRTHGGRIDVTSAVGVGSTFLVVLPLASGADVPAPVRSLRSVNVA